MKFNDLVRLLFDNYCMSETIPSDKPNQIRFKVLCKLCKDFEVKPNTPTDEFLAHFTEKHKDVLKGMGIVMSKPDKMGFVAKPKKRIVYARGFPYGAPLFMLRGAATKEIKPFLKEKGFQYDPMLYAWKTYLDGEDVRLFLLELQKMGFEVVPKDDMRKELIVNLKEGE